MMDLHDNLRRLTKIELHRHLEGSVRPSTVAEICRERAIPLPIYDPVELARLLQLTESVGDLGEFFLPFRTIKFAFADREAIARIAYEVAEDAAADNIRYVEIRFSPEFMAFYHRLPMTQVMDGIVEGVELAKKAFPIQVGLIVSISRDLSESTMGMVWPSPREVAELAVEYADRGVVGLDLAGREYGYPAELFAEPYKIARDAGLGITCHAGEDDGPESVRSAIEILGATRIGHGVRIARDPEVMRLVADRGVVLEICPTSNILTHAVNSLDDHPMRDLFDYGIRVTINSDDPTVCGTTLTGEYMIAVEHFGFSMTEIEQTIETARVAAFSEVV